MKGENNKFTCESVSSNGSDLEAKVLRAISGDSVAIEQLIQITTPRIRRYIYRSTLDHNLTDDLVQDVHCRMLESISKLRDASAFWGWLYRIASNCVKSHYRGKSKQAGNVSLKDGMLEMIACDNEGVDSSMMRSELVQAVMESISTLTPRHRQVITLRCLENMSFKEIGRIENVNEVYTRVVFSRAIEKLRIALRKRGFKAASTVFVLAVFGKATSFCRADAIAIKAETIKAAGVAGGSGVGGTIIGAVAKVSVHYIKTAIILMAAAGAAMAPTAVGPFRSNVQSIHYTVQGVRPAEPEDDRQIQKQRSRSSFGFDRANTKYETMGLYEKYMYLPDGPDGAMFLFSQRWSMDGTRLCSWLQDGNAYYYYASDKKKIHITNDPLRQLVLPTDDPELVEFIRSHVGYDSRYSTERKWLTGLIKKTTDNRVPEYSGLTQKFAYNKTGLSDLTEHWPDIDNIEDKRDQMHKRGWAFFNITGQVNGIKVKGSGKIPFSYNMSKQHTPWLYLVVGDDWYIDYCDEICFAGSGQERVQYKGGAFFQGLLRPWQGFACVDSICRDAAKYRIPFELVDQGSSASITLYMNTEKGKFKVVYDIDRDVDIIRSIQILKGDNIVGDLVFNYAQQIDDPDNGRYIAPQIDPSSRKRKEPAQLWLSMLLTK